MARLLLLQQRLSLSVLGDNGATCEGILPDEAGETDQDGQDEEDAHDCECEDPLEGDGVGKELGDTKGWSVVSRFDPEIEVVENLPAERTLRLKPMV